MLTQSVVITQAYIDMIQVETDEVVPHKQHVNET